MPIKVYFDGEPQVTEEDTLLKKYNRIRAGGGLVVDTEGKVLMIFRRGRWDLPKGKFEEGETIEQCAAREVSEETGLTELVLKKFLITTYHTYSEKKGFYLKETHWFLFNAPANQTLVPQTEEDITKIEWVSAADLEQYTTDTFGLIRDVLQEGGYL